MTFVFVLLTVCLLISGIARRQKDAAVLPVCATVLFLSACVCAGGAVRAVTSDGLAAYAALPFVTVFKQKYYWQLCFDDVSSCAVSFMTAFAFLFAAGAAVRRETFAGRNAFYLFGVCVGAFLCFGARNVFQFLAGWEITGVSAGMTAFCFNGSGAVVTARRRFRLYGALADAPLYVLLAAACVRAQSYDLSGTALLNAKMFALLWGVSLLLKTKCLAVLSRAETDVLPFAFAAGVLGVCYAYFLTGFAPAAFDFSFAPAFAAVVCVWFLTAAGLLLKRRFGAKGVSRARKKRRMFFALLSRRFDVLRENARLENLLPAFVQNFLSFVHRMHAKGCPFASAFLIGAAGVAVCLAFAFLLRGVK